MLQKLIENKTNQIILCGSIAFFFACCGIAVLKSSDFNLEAANTKISLSSQINKAKNITNELQQQANSIDAERENYRILKEKYDRLIVRSNSKEFKELSPLIQKIDSSETGELKEDIQTTNKKIEQLEKAITN